MTPALCTKVAQRLFPIRWWLLAAFIGFMLLFGLTVVFADVQRWGPVAMLLAGPLFGLTWAGLCAAAWFHPERGTLQPGGRRARNIPPPMHAILRWFGAVFLTVVVVFSGLVWPIAMLTGH